MLICKKVGMTSIFSESRDRIPVTVLKSSSCFVLGYGSLGDDLYQIKVSYGVLPENKVSKPLRGIYKDNINGFPDYITTFKVQGVDFKIGDRLGVGMFSPGDRVKVYGTSKGKGFAGCMKRHNFSGLPTSHGASKKVRSRGASGGGSGSQQKVFKGTKMPGRLGNKRVCMRNLKIIKVDIAEDLLILKGSIPGSIGGMVTIRTEIC